ncbi:MAG: methyltransferase domain-containing protein [Alphaproteobacteria bacterium]|nr:methyltransferase domain-containing protein [Alphaproteobacteria bacterium]
MGAGHLSAPLHSGPPVAYRVPPLAGRGAAVPWWVKIAAKLVLSRVLPSYAWRRRLGIGVHSFATALDGNRALVAHDLAWFATIAGRPASSLLELGPGDTIATALYAAARGVRRIGLMDGGDHASPDMAAYRAIAEGLDPDFLDTAFAAGLDFTNRDTLLASLGATYLTGGLADLAGIPDGSVDLTLSYTVLEHVRRAEFTPLMAELHRITSPGGLPHHLIDLMDHLGGGLNNLRWGDALWEHPAIAGSGFYTNRLSRAEITAAAEEVGFETAIPYISRWDATPHVRPHCQFAGRSPEALGEASFGLYLRRD